jgi:hypothetical protein
LLQVAVVLLVAVAVAVATENRQAQQLAPALLTQSLLGRAVPAGQHPLRAVVRQLWADRRLHSNRPELFPQVVVKALIVKRQAVVEALVAAGLMVGPVEQDRPEEVGIRHQPLHLRVTMAARVSRLTQHQTAVAAAAQVL